MTVSNGYELVGSNMAHGEADAMVQRLSPLFNDGYDCNGNPTAAAEDLCPADPAKTEPGACGCGTPDADSDGDGYFDCLEQCDADPAKQQPGQCGCDTPDTDSDGDQVPDCLETCDKSEIKTEPGICGC